MITPTQTPNETNTMIQKLRKSENDLQANIKLIELEYELKTGDQDQSEWFYNKIKQLIVNYGGRI